MFGARPKPLLDSIARRPKPLLGAGVWVGRSTASVCLDISSKSSSGRILANLGAGELVGELSFLDSRLPTASVTASASSAVLCIGRSILAAKLEVDHPFAARIYRTFGIVVASRLRMTLATLGGGDPADDDDRLDDDALDNVTVAGARFEWLLERLRSVQ